MKHEMGPNQLPDATNILLVTSSSDGQRLDNFLFRHFRNQSRSFVYKLVRSGQIRVNSARCKAFSRLVAGDKVRLPPRFVAGEKHLPRLSEKQRQHILANILYQDEDIMAFDKPAGQVVHAGTGHNFGLIEALRSCLPEVEFLELVHRIDRLTSGCVLIAKNAVMRNRLHQCWRNQIVKKTYYALVHGRWPMNKTYIDLSLIYQSTPGLTRVLVNSQGKKASTRIVVLGYYSLGQASVSLLRLMPETGRMHQLRVHCQSVGHPILGDPLYQNKEQEHFVNKYCQTSRMYLHAHSLILPDTFSPNEFVAPGHQWLSDMRKIVDNDWHPS